MKLANPFQPFYEQCNRPMAEQMANLPPFPIMIDVELTNLCNMKCKMCPTGQKKVKRPKGMMSGFTFSRVMELSDKYKTPLRFIRWGEPMFNPRWADYIRHAVSRGRLTHMNTNGLMLTPDNMSLIFETGLDSLKISMQGYDEKTYGFMRQDGFFNTLLERLGTLYQIRNERGYNKPYIQVGITVEQDEMPLLEPLKEKLAPICDDIFIGITRDLSATNPRKAACECPEVFSKLSVDFDGLVVACCGDWDRFMPVGHIYYDTLEEIWNGKILNEYRQMLLDYQHYKMPLCKHCARSKL